MRRISPLYWLGWLLDLVGEYEGRSRRQAIIEARAREENTHAQGH